MKFIKARGFRSKAKRPFGKSRIIFYGPKYQYLNLITFRAFLSKVSFQTVQLAACGSTKLNFFQPNCAVAQCTHSQDVNFQQLPLPTLNFLPGWLLDSSVILKHKSHLVSFANIMLTQTLKINIVLLITGKFITN